MQRIVCVVLLWLLSVTITRAQQVSNEGTQFWAVFPSHDPSQTMNGSFREAKITIYVTAKVKSEVTVTCNGNSLGPITIEPNKVKSFLVPRSDAYIDYSDRNKPLSNKGIFIKVSDGMPKVAVYAHISAGARSAASLILPLEALGQKYFSMNFTQTTEGNGKNRNFLTLVASENNTDILVHPKSGSSFKVHLSNAGDVYQYMPEGNEDLTGTYAEIDPGSADNCTKRFAAFSGSTSVSIGCASSRDPLYQQLYPTVSWGKTYAAIPFINRYFYYRVLAQEDYTIVNASDNGSPVVLNKGQMYTSGRMSDPVYITADKNISVAQYALTQDCGSPLPNLYGDPEMVLLNPVEFNIRNITLFSSREEDIKEKYINVCMSTAATGSFRLNGQPVANANWSVVPSNPALSYVQLQVYDLNSTLSASEGFNAIAYGFGDHESYAYSAGTNLAANNYLLISNTVTGFEAPNACKDQASDFKIVFPFRPKDDRVIWQLDEEIPVTTMTVPKEIVSPGGQVLYEYIYAAKRTFDRIETHTMKVTAVMPDTESCLGRPVDYEFAFSVYPIPAAAFDAPKEICFGTALTLTDKSTLNVADVPVNKWIWDLGENSQTSSEQNPVYTYSTSGVKTIKLTAGLEEGCLSDPVEVQVLVKPRITAGFEMNSTECISSEVVVLDKTIVEGGIQPSSWRWNFGDGSPEITTQAAKHIYSRPGTYQVTLIAGTSDGCLSAAISKSVTIEALPKADFALPEICVNDKDAVFINRSSDDAGNKSELTYLWNFGDAGNPLNSDTQENPAHKYLAPGKYTVTLTVVTKNGCTATTSKELFVNGADAIADFDVMNSKALCSREKVTVVNRARVAPGNIVRIVWIPDNTQPAQTITDEDPEPGKTYDFTYPAATSPLPKEYTIVMRAYSGQTCYQETQQTITIYPNPEVVFEAIDPVCLNTGPVKISSAGEQLGVAGIGVFSGRGVSKDGTFDPGAAGAGTHVITYTFSNAQGCDDVKTQSITVYDIPVVSNPRDVFMYPGDQRQLDLGSESGLTYRWQPADGLDKDDIPNPVVTADTEKTYTITIANQNGCSVVEKLNVHIIPDVVPPNSFSPNGDGRNDTWVIKNMEIYLNATVEIFNRYGQRVYFSKGFYKPFDGKYNGQFLPVGTYYYIINLNNSRKPLTGPLTILK